MTRVLVISDTHMPRPRRELARSVLRELSRADIILHLGDYTRLSVAEELERYGPLIGIHGNNDDEDVRQNYPARRELEIDGKLVVMIHGDVGGRTAIQAARAQSRGDVVLFGHSHQAHIEWLDGRLLLNPGSPTDKRWSPFRSIALLEMGETIEAKLLPLD
jgi:putative phosphoesterase